MTEQEFEDIRNKDHVVLQHIEEGLDDTQKITAETTLQNHEVRYSLKKLEQLGLISLEKPDKMVERVVDGQKRVFQHPLQATLTKKGLQKLSEHDNEEIQKYESLSHDELVEKVHCLEEQVSELERTLQVFREQVRRSI